MTHPSAPAALPLGAWLAELSDERLIRLLELRPDLAQPAPGSIAALAARAAARQSMKAATDELDFLRLAVLDALLVLHAEVTAVPVAKLVALIGERADEDTVLAALDDLRARALVGATPRCGCPPKRPPGCPGIRGRPSSRTPLGLRRRSPPPSTPSTNRSRNC